MLAIFSDILAHPKAVYAFWVWFNALLGVAFATGAVVLAPGRAKLGPLNLPFKPVKDSKESGGKRYSALHSIRMLFAHLHGIAFVYSGYYLSYTDILNSHDQLKTLAFGCIFCFGLMQTILHTKLIYERVVLGNQMSKPSTICVCTFGQITIGGFQFALLQEIAKADVGTHGAARDALVSLAVAGLVSGIGGIAGIRLFKFLSVGLDADRFEKEFLAPQVGGSQKKEK
mmetsp:Transcript_63470/g.75113  ORF Transcript_63470/g.75113 Transcript_63470/m.75113 type:complete len:228 (-) Transcript_63470:119-802(-)